jgi:hypothetical protein
MSGSGYGSTFAWSLASQSTANNTSTINWSWTADWASSTYVISSQANLYLDGALIFQNAYNTGRKMYGGQQASGARTISHNSDGTRSFGANGEAAFIQYALNAWGSGSWDLPTIPLNATITSAKNFDDTGNPSFTYSNPAGGSNTMKDAWLEINPESTHLAIRQIGTATSGTYNWSLTEDERNQLRAAIPNANTATCRIGFINSITGNATYIDKTFTIINANPTFKAFDYKDSNATVAAITGNDQVLVQGQSTLQATVTAAQKMVTKKYATPSSYSFQFGAVNASAAYASSDVVASLGAPDTAGTQRLRVKALDSRSNVTVIYKDIEVVPYNAPVINASVTRDDGGFSIQSTLSIAGTFSLVQVGGVTKNAVNTTSGVKYRYKRSDTSTWGDWTNATATISGSSISVANILMNCDNQYQWDFEVSITDRFTTTTVPLTLSVGIPIFRIGTDGYCYNNEQPLMPSHIGQIIISTTLDTAAKVKAIYGGTWVTFGAGRTIVGVDAGDSDFNAPEKTGGSKSVTLTTDQIPSHQHKLSLSNYGSDSASGVVWNTSSVKKYAYSADMVEPVGGGQSHPNLAPYITCYLWKRTT